MGKQDDFYRTQIRIPADLHRALKEATEESGRSLNAEIVARLNDSFRAEETLERFNVMSVTLDEKLEKVRKEIDQMEKSKSEASEFIEQIKALTNKEVKED
ncbi:Arc family DNA-binding protein [Marinobacter adhaerens]|uniref:Arc family DNA-binding protein n=1 Tax=Marinobacter adhaerens TaxID=1033846 RepID=UPI003BACF14D